MNKLSIYDVCDWLGLKIWEVDPDQRFRFIESMLDAVQKHRFKPGVRVSFGHFLDLSKEVKEWIEDRLEELTDDKYEFRFKAHGLEVRLNHTEDGGFLVPRRFEAAIHEMLSAQWEYTQTYRWFRLPQDIIVLSSDRAWTIEAKANVVSQVRDVFGPDPKIVFLDWGLQMQIISN